VKHTYLEFFYWKRKLYVILRYYVIESPKVKNLMSEMSVCEIVSIRTNCVVSSRGTLLMTSIGSQDHLTVCDFFLEGLFQKHNVRHLMTSWKFEIEVAAISIESWNTDGIITINHMHNVSVRLFVGLCLRIIRTDIVFWIHEDMRFLTYGLLMIHIYITT